MVMRKRLDTTGRTAPGTRENLLTFSSSNCFPLTLLLKVAIFTVQNGAKKLKITGTLACGYSSEGTQRELSNEYQHDMETIVLIKVAILFKIR